MKNVIFISCPIGAFSHLLPNFKPKILFGFIFLFTLSSCHQEGNGIQEITKPTTPEKRLNVCDQQTDAFCFDPVIQLFTITGLPSYPGCIFEVAANGCFKQDESIIIDVVILSHNCTKYSDSLAYFLNTPDPYDDILYNNRFEKELNTRVDFAVFETFAGADISCNNINNTAYSVTFVSAQCQALCYYYVGFDKKREDGPPGGGRDIKPVIVTRKASCNGEGCCIWRSTLCRNENGDLQVVVSNPTPALFSTCSGSVPSSPTPSGLILIRCLSCLFSCAK